MPNFFDFVQPGGSTGGPQQPIPGGQQSPSNFFDFVQPGGSIGGPPTGDQDFSGGQAGPNMWDKLVNFVGQGKPMPGTTIGAPAGGRMAPTAVPPMIPPPGQMQRPPGIPNLSALLNPTAGGAGNSGLMSQYMALQRLMQGA